MKYIISSNISPCNLEHSFHIFWIFFRNKLQAEKFRQYMLTNIVEVLYHYSALHESPMAKMISDSIPDCPISLKISEGLD